MKISMAVKIELLEKEDVVGILSGICSYSGFWCPKMSWDENLYKAKKEELKLKNPEEEVCFEDVLTELLFDNSPIIFEDDEEVKHELTLEKLTKGIENAISRGLVSVDPDEWDATDNDTILQIALFDETIYG